MHSRTLALANLLTAPPESATPRWAFPALNGAPQPLRGVWLLAALAGVLGAQCMLWFAAGASGVSVGSLLLAAVAFWLAYSHRTNAERNLDELARLANEFGEATAKAPFETTLSGRWRDVARQFSEAHEALVRQLAARQAADQSLELAQRLAVSNQRRVEAVLDSLADVVLVTNPFGELLLANPSAERLFGFEAATARGKAVPEVVPHAALAQRMQQVIQRCAGHQRHSEELSLECAGKPRWFKVSITAATDRSADLLGVVTVLRDVTSEKAALARSAEFVSAVSHEIKTPLASVKAYAEMLADGDAADDPDMQHKFLGIIQAQTDRMTRLLEGMLDMARIESGVVRVDKKLISLNEIIESGAKLMDPAAADKKITLERRLSSLYLGVEVDSDMMNRVVMNLVSNAIKYTDSGGRIVLRSQMLGNLASFEVEDTGHGIPAEAMARLFQKFYRVKENANVASGTGLGLSLVKHIVEEVHGGKIDVQSKVGEGSTFRVLLRLEGTCPTE